MIDSLVIFSKYGPVLYMHNGAAEDASASKAEKDGEEGEEYSTSLLLTSPSTKEKNREKDGKGEDSEGPIEVVNTFLSTLWLDSKWRAEALTPNKDKCTKLPTSTVYVEWEEGAAVLPAGQGRDWMILASYSDVVVRKCGPEIQPGVTSVPWIRSLLKATIKEYALFHHSVADTSHPAKATVPSDSTQLFDATFSILFRQAEASAGINAAQRSAPVSRPTVSLGHRSLAGSENQENDSHMLDPNDADRNEIIDVKAGLERLKKRAQSKGNSSATATPKKKGKEKTVWHDGNGPVTKEAMAELDKSGSTSELPQGVDSIDAAVMEGSRALAEARAAYLPQDDETPAWEEEMQLDDEAADEEEHDDDDEDADSAKKTTGWGASLRGLFDQMAGNKVLTAEDLEAPLADMQGLLTSKNVAAETAAQMVSGVRARLVGKRLKSFARVKAAVRQALEESIERILQPSTGGKELDVLQAVVTKREKGGFLGGLLGSSAANKSQSEPYVIVMIGINGVGKSTSLAKIAYYLKERGGCSPLIAACDTFRSGAVEQLNVHAKCLGVPLFHKGYAKDPSSVAREAIARASREGNDVVLVDTAGRMQNNVPLMKALSKLIVENSPDLVLFVCEALVGNDGMDQLRMFDRSLRSGGHRRPIDGVVLTKFDTVSDKVGAALTMAHISGSPIAFVGTGQKYNHLKKLSVPAVIKSLFS